MNGASTADETFLLALVNTTPTVDGTVRDELSDAASARAWLDAHHGEAHAHEDLEVLRSTRDALQGLIRGDATPRDLAAALEDVAYRATLGDDGVVWDLTAPPGRGLAARAVLAWDSLRRSAPGRLRPCGNDECTRFFLDRSKNNSARWCSMAGCGNRLKARRHYERHKGATVPRTRGSEQHASREAG
ncbi:CGNR zinc finger domain-containing protein [Actinacidiphila acididurans]|uniref:CGNR zinc finger domain-containing protein n=1 Tax=Actinacidiphila acididurans TaxID=2784346 RepID=A0ABS2TTC6_9ACTN|nr:CGNR zinc finger domain-containing protein [Actinacidiphila acididurans]MBM9506589.1 CGNR zinc finger domain-containing protein [Actinacidiphila acididurans]